MADVDSVVNLKITADIAKATKDIAQLTSQSVKTLKKVEEQTTLTSKAFSSLLGNLGATAITAGVESVANSMRGLFNLVITDGINSATEYQDALNQLSFSFSSVGIDAVTATEDFDDFASQLERNSRFTDDQIVSNAAYLQSLARLSTRGLKVATQAAVDLASATGKPLETAIDLVAKAANGSVTGLNKLGFSIKKGATDAETFQNALAVLSKLQGAGVASLNTFGGAVDNVSKSFNNFVKEIGNLIIEDPFLRELLNRVAVLFQDLGESVKSVGSLQNVVDGLIRKINSLISRMVALSLAFATAFVATNFTLTLDFFKKLGPLVSTGVTSVKAFGASLKSQVIIFNELKAAGYSTTQAIRLGFKAGELAVGAFRVAVNIAKAALTLGLTLVIDDLIGRFLRLKEAGVTFGGSLKGVFLSLAADVLGIFASLYDGIAKLTSKSFFTKGISGAFQVSADSLRSLADGFQKDFDSMVKGSESAGSEIANGLKAGVKDASLFAEKELPEITEAVLQVASKAGSSASFGKIIETQLETLNAALANSLITQEQYELQRLAIVQESEARLIEERLKQQELLLQQQGLDQDQLLQSKLNFINAELAQENLRSSQTIALAAARAKVIADIEKKANEQRLKDQSAFFSAATTLQSSKTQELAAIGKAAAITEIAIKTPPAVASSFAFGASIAGPALGFILAGIAATAMAAQAANIAGVPLATGMTSVPKGFPNDTFKANLTSGERVVNVAQNKDLTAFLDRQSSDKSKDESNELLRGIMDRLGALENTIVVNIGNREIMREVRDGLRSGRQLVAT